MIARMITRMLARRANCGAVAAESLWIDFLSSPEFQSLENAAAASSSSCLDSTNQQQLTAPPPPLTVWTDALARACSLWKVLAVDGDGSSDYDKAEQAEIWTVLCFLIKGTFYAANNLSLSRLQQEPNDQFLLHAAIEALSLCCCCGSPQGSSEVNDRRQSNAIKIFRRVFQLCANDGQLSQPGPVWNRLPLHMAASSNNNRTMMMNPPSKIDNVKDFSGQVLEMVLDQSPASAVVTPDAKGLYPFHLACASGFSWTSGLELLFRAAPHIPSMPQQQSLFVLLSESSQDGAMIQTKKKRLRHWIRKMVFKHRHQKRGGKSHSDVEAVNTIFQLIYTDPSALNMGLVVQQ